MIELKNITFGYDKRTVLSNLSLVAEKSAVTCLLGGSGSGKTTVLRLLAGLEVPQGGNIVIRDKVVSEAGKVVVPPARRRVGFIFQDLALWPHFTVFDNVAFGLKENHAKDIEIQVMSMLKLFALDKYAYKYPHQLSGGQKQLAAIARSLVMKPEILLMDEPLANLDVKLKRKIISHIVALKKEFELAVIYVTHDHREAFAMADKIAVLHDGMIELAGTTEEIKNSDNEYVKFFLEY